MNRQDHQSNVPFPESLKQESQLETFLEDDTYWTEVYLSEGLAGRALHAAFTPITMRGEVLESEIWESAIGDGRPGFVVYGGGHTGYYRHGCRHDDALPITIKNSNYGIGPPVLPEIVEEFRHLMELRPNSDHTEFYKLMPDGTLDPAALVSESSVRIRTKYLRQYQAARQLDLVRFMDSRVWEPGNHTASFTATYGNDLREIVGPNYRLRMWPYYGQPHLSRDATVTLLMGKRVIPAPPRQNAGMWPWNEHDIEEYQEFCIGEDELGTPITYTCDPDCLANYFGANPDAPHYLTPVWFRPEVLQKYYADPKKYEVADGNLSCGALWGVHIDNDNSDGFVMVWLGDLGRDIPATECLHWKAHNIVLPRVGSSTAIKRQILGQWADPESPAFVFKQKYALFQDVWREQHDWDLFRELTGPNAHTFERIRTPLDGTDREFEDILKDLHLVLIESLNPTQLKANISGDTKSMKSISLFERWLEELDYPPLSLERDTGFLRALNEVRSLCSHLRSRAHEQRLSELGVTQDRIATIGRYYQQSIAMLDNLRTFFGVTGGD